MTNPIPPCPVCGVVPEWTGEFCDIETQCHHVHGVYETIDETEWVEMCDRKLGRALRTHGIHTLSELDEIINCAKDKYYHDVLLARDFWYNEHAKLAAENVRLKVNLESRLAPDPRVAVQQEVICPFCLDGDFDTIGLKIHLQSGHCDTYNSTSIAAQRGDG